MNLRTRYLFLVLILLAAPISVRAAGLPPIAEIRGDFYYDADGEFIGIRHATLPEMHTRVPMSHIEKFQLLGLEMPDRRADLAARRIYPKRDRVLEYEGLEYDKVAVKFVDQMPVRMREEHLTQNGSQIADVKMILAGYPDAVVTRTFTEAEYILDDNRFSGEVISGRELPDLNNYYLIRFPSPTPRSVALANELLALDIVETAYIEQEAGTPSCEDLDPVTPLWETDQNYLDDAPDGIDAYHAWGYHPDGNGTPSFWVMDLEWEWCPNHEDLDFDNDDVVNGHTVGVERQMNHGTAVLGEIGACDNEYGMTGIVSDVTLKASDFDSENSQADNITTADSFLLAGEVMLLEIHKAGPVTGNPCPCPDTCWTLDWVPVEYNHACHAAIETAVANGIIVIEAGGNGAVNLDWGIYDDWFELANDSGAIMVGAAVNDGTHDVACFSNYGETVDVHAYGAGVYTTGYGYLFEDATWCDQSYTSSFGGTSGASPIVTGAAASLQCIAKGKYGITLSPAQVRSALRYDGTPQGAPLEDYIGPMPDMESAIRYIQPDLRSDYHPAGWSYPAVPRTVGSSSIGSVSLPSGMLSGNSHSTYWNWNLRNYSYALMPSSEPPVSWIYVDDILAGGVSWPYTIAPGTWNEVLNYGPTTVTGGRHTVRAMADPQNIEPESSDTNNDWARQYIWTPLVLEEDSPVSRHWSPYATSIGWGPHYNAEGFSGNSSTGTYWYAFAVMPANPGSDFDVAVHSEAPSNIPQAGFGAYEARSAQGAGVGDFVIIDRNTVGAGTYYGGVQLWGGSVEDEKIVEFDGDEGLVTTGTFGPFTLEASDLLELHEIQFESGIEYRIEVEVIGGAADYGLSVYGGETGYYEKLTALPGGYAESAGPGESESVLVSGEDGYYGIVVWKEGAADLLQTLTYQLTVTVDPNLTESTPDGWYGPVVPRNTVDATSTWAPLPDVLAGGVTTTSYNFATLNEGPSTVPALWETRLFLDDISYWTGSGSILNADEIRTWRNTPQGYDPWSLVRGGRHHVRITADQLDQIPERDEEDNDFTEWFIWSPFDLYDQIPFTRDAPPIKNPLGHGPWYSCDGYRVDAATGVFWSAVGIMPVSGSDDYDLRMYDASTGSRDGFGPYLETSIAGAGLVNFTVVNRNQSAFVDIDYGVFNSNGGAGDFAIQQADGYLNGSYTGDVINTETFAIDSGHILNTHEFYINSPGNPVYISLENISGNADLGVAVFDGQIPYQSKINYMALADAGGAGEGEVLAPITLSAAEFTCIVVYKAGSADLSLPSSYSLVLSPDPFSHVDSYDLPPERFAFAAPNPNPFTGSTHIRYETPRNISQASIAVCDVQGRLVRNLLQGAVPAGRHSVDWDARDSSGRRVAAGIYFVRFEFPERVETRLVVLLN
jgi:serine protease